MEEGYREPRGLGRLDIVKTGEKRKENQNKDSQQQNKKRRKLQFPTLSEDWGLEGDLERLEDEENRKVAFLLEGISDVTSGRASLQLTIKKWSANEIYFRKIIQDIIKQSAEKGSFMSSLQEGICQNMMKVARSGISTEGSNQPFMSSLQEGSCQNMMKLAKSGMSTSGSNQPYQGDGGRRQESTEMKPIVNKDETHLNAKNKTIKQMFKAKFLSLEKAEIDKLEKEERLDKKKRLQQGWKTKRAHHERLHSA